MNPSDNKPESLHQVHIKVSKYACNNECVHVLGCSATLGSYLNYVEELAFLASSLLLLHMLVKHATCGAVGTGSPSQLSITGLGFIKP